MIEKLAFITALGDAVTAIAASNWATWSAAHSADTYFEKINARLLVLMEYYDQVDIDTLCQYLVANTLVPAPQSIPSALFWPYKNNACRSNPRGVIRKRVPATVVKSRSGKQVGAPGSHRWGTWEIFLKGVQCLWRQPLTGGQTNEQAGPMARSTWYTQSSGSGLFWLNYFMQHTLDYMYGGSKPDTWPFTFRCPPWCVTKHYRFKLNAYGDEGYAALNMVYFPPAGAQYGSGLIAYVRISPDTSKPNPGDMDVGYLFSQHASMNTDYEVQGAYTEATLDPLPASSTAWPLVCTRYADDPWLYQYLEFFEMDGCYLIDIFVSSNLNFLEPDSVYSENMGGTWY